MTPMRIHAQTTWLTATATRKARIRVTTRGFNGKGRRTVTQAAAGPEDDLATHTKAVETVIGQALPLGATVTAVGRGYSYIIE
jgi:hypothetical protein